ncbi:MAG: NAD-binding protein, partial [Fervidobacterium sp.]
MNKDTTTFEERLKRRIKISVGGIIFVFTVGTLYYWIFEKIPFLEALFFTGITISTVGYGIPKELSPHGKLFTLLLILVGLSFVLYSISYITATIVEGELGKVFKNRRIERRVSKMKDHVIVVGIGNIGTQVIKRLLRYESYVVAIDKNLDEETALSRIPNGKEKLVLITGDATSEDTLIKAGISQARALITTLPDDALNIFVALTAKN